MSVARCIAIVLLPASVQAAGLSEGANSERDEELASGEDVESEAPADADYWELGETRPFVSAFGILGIYSEAQLSAGYGKPFWTWGGLTGSVMGYPGMFAAAIGPRLELGLVNLSVRYRRTWSTANYAQRAPVYNAESFQDPDQPDAHYSSLDVDLWGFVPAGPTTGFWAFRGVWVPGIDDGQALNSEMLRSTLEGAPGLMPQMIWWGHLFDRALSVGPAVDAVFTAQRDPLVRVGGSVLYQFGPHLSVEMMLTVPVTSPDDFPIVDEVWGNLDIGWAFATGEDKPGFL